MSSSENSFDEILDDFVVPDDTIEYEDATAELPSSPFSGADMRRGVELRNRTRETWTLQTV